LDVIRGGATRLLEKAIAPNMPSADARAHIQLVVYTLNLSAREGNPAAVAQLESLARRRDVVSACCVGCGAVRKLKTCFKCSIARFCDTECTAHMWPAHKASCKAWRAERDAEGNA
jgi:hypothetical protein